MGGEGGEAGVVHWAAIEAAGRAERVDLMRDRRARLAQASEGGMIGVGIVGICSGDVLERCSAFGAGTGVGDIACCVGFGAVGAWWGGAGQGVARDL